MLKLYEKSNPRNNPYGNECRKERMEQSKEDQGKYNKMAYDRTTPTLPQFKTAILATIGVNGGQQ